MDPQTMISDGPSYNIAEIWPFPMNGGGGVAESGGDFGFGMKRGQFGQNLKQFVKERNVNPEVSYDDPMSVNTASRRGGRKPQDEELEAPKGLSTSNGMIDFDSKWLQTSACKDYSHDAKAEMEVVSSKPADETARQKEPWKLCHPSLQMKLLDRKNHPTKIISMYGLEGVKLQIATV